MVKDLSEVKTAEISFVDRGANKKKFLILKRENEGSTQNLEGGELAVNEKELEALETLKDLDVEDLEKQYGKPDKHPVQLPSNIVTLIKDVLTKLGQLVGYSKAKKNDDTNDELTSQVKELQDKVNKLLGEKKGDGKNKDGEQENEIVKQVKELNDKVNELVKKQDENKGGEGDGDKNKGEGDKPAADGDKGKDTGDKGKEGEEKPGEEITKHMTGLVEKLQNAKTTKDIIEVMKELQGIQIKKKDEGKENKDEVKTLIQKIADKVELLDDKVTKIEMSSAGIKGQDSEKSGDKSDWGGVFK